MSSAIRTAGADQLEAVVAGTSDNPFAILGRHQTTVDGRPALIIRTLQPAAAAVELVTDAGVISMTRRRPEGLFEAVLPLEGRDLHDVGYRFRVHEGSVAREVVDPYQFGQVLSDFDLHLLSEG